METIRFGGVTYSLPYLDILPPLPPAKFESLRNDIRKAGEVYVPIFINEHNHVIDGANRLKIAALDNMKPDLVPFVVLPGLTEEQERERAYDFNLNRRQLTIEEEAAARVRRIHRVAEASRAKKSERQIATEENVSRVTVQRDKAEAVALGIPIGPPEEPGEEAKPKEKPAAKAKGKGKDKDKPKGKRGRKPKPPVPVKDGAGNELPEHLRGFYANPKLDEWVAILEKLHKEVHAAVGSWAYHLAPEAVDHLGDAAQLIKDAKPYAVCPHCEGAEGGCEFCKTSGLVPKHVWDDHVLSQQGAATA
jgi:hypothetical protein